MNPKEFLRIGVFYDGTYFTLGQNYYWGKKYGWLSFKEFHKLLEKIVGRKEQGYSSYKIVYSAFFQGLHKKASATDDNLRKDRQTHLDLLHAGIEYKSLPMSDSMGENGKEREKGIDVYMAVETLLVGLGNKIDIAILVTGDGDFVPLTRALMKNGVMVFISHFDYEDETGHKSFANERLLNAANHAININRLEDDREFKSEFEKIFIKSNKKSVV